MYKAGPIAESWIILATVDSDVLRKRKPRVFLTLQNAKNSRMKPHGYFVTKAHIQKQNKSDP